VHLDLQRRAQSLGEEVNRVGIHQLARLDTVGGADAKQPSDVVTLVTGDAFELEHGGSISDLLHRRPPEIVAELGMANQQ
jgi:hypothetical protein